MASVPLRKPTNPLTVATTTRVTKSGRTIRYDLTVIQQPERARACGSGAKSSADRRPVDPPPVVELRIFEKIVDKWDDITFAYGANFFLFATLEVARPMAHGRVQQPSAPQIPVLTGMPVSGMAYLDRPAEAGYFIFPDLSVRHEGKYILSFNLYEETRPDSEQDVKDNKSMGGVMLPDASFDWRLEIKSELFTVFSAKKFPGLAESTSLSRTVAEQGCRVRIRRDVRMRRREDKGNGGMDVQEDDYRSGRPMEQDPYQARSRSKSGTPDGHPEYQNGSRSATHSPILPNLPGRNHLNFGDRNDSSGAPGQFATPNRFGPPQSQQQFPPPQAPYQQQGPQYPTYGQAQPPTAHSGYGERMYPSSAVESRREREVYENPDLRRASVASYQPTYPSQHGPPPAVDQNYNRQPWNGYTSSPAMATQLPPLRGEIRDSIAPAPGQLAPLNFPPIRSPTAERNERPAPAPYQYSGPALAPAPLTPALPAEPMRNGGKRTYDSVFSSSATTQPLHNGMRPGSSHGDKPAVDKDDDDMEIGIDMTYKRADGRDSQRYLPKPK
ncbi:velvet factor-domain-containing protein [Leptodontidium sp. MPI-SDFR-AT-0119]|nr:velvet factor-domain-containing protein [Leptodontidium sp. MPI-SDFR-AT-0119]